MRKILFIVEGEKGEPQLYKAIQNIFLKLDINKFEYISYNTNIYHLYEEIKNDGDLDMLELVKEKAKRDNIEVYNKLKNETFTEIFLIFDLEPHDPNFSFVKIEEMVELFHDETEMGKLYINYPMFESIKHFFKLPDENYNTYTFLKKDLHNNGYKKYIDKISKIDLTKLNYEKLRIIINQTLEKYEYVTGKNITKSKEEYNKNFSQKELLKIQKSMLEEDALLVINTFCLWPIEYFNEKVFRKIVRI